MKKAVVSILLACFFIVAVIQDRSGAANKSLHIKDAERVVSAQLMPAHAGAGSTTITLNLQNNMDKEVIAKVLNWLKSSRVVGDAKDQFVSLGGSPTQFTIKFQSGETVSIMDAVGTSLPNKLPNGSIHIHSQQISGQVTILQGQHTRRLYAPELKTWIAGGWQQEGPFKFDEAEAIAKALKEHPEFPSNPEKVNTNDEPIGGPSDKQTVTLTTKVEKYDQFGYIGNTA